MEYESVNYDLVIVGAGPAGLSSAIKLKQLDKKNNTNHSVCIIEKGAEVGSHIISGAILDTLALSELFPNWKEMDAPIKTRVAEEEFSILLENSHINLPNFLLPESLKNKNNYIISLSNLCKWLAKVAEDMGVEIFPGFSAKKIIYDNAGEVEGVLTGEKGIKKDGSKSDLYEPPLALKGKQTFFAEGCRGHLGEELIAKFQLRSKNNFQTYAIGLKEVWELKKENTHPGKVFHSIGWPLPNDTYGGSFIYHMEDSLASIGFVVGLDYKNPYLDPYLEFQKFKTHYKIKNILEGGKRITYGARALNEGGYQSLPKMTFPGGALIGCEAGTLNVPRIKGTHTAMKSGIIAAEEFHKESSNKFEGGRELLSFKKEFKSSWIYKELYKARNVRPGFKWGLIGGILNAGIDQSIFRGKAPWTIKHNQPDHSSTEEKNNYKPIVYPKADGIISFERLTNVSFSGTNHKEDQPCHLILKNSKKPIEINLAKYDSPETKYCPAGVYEIIDKNTEKARLQINFQNCIHCKTCDIKDPLQNIIWTPPEGGEGPKYSNT